MVGEERPEGAVCLKRNLSPKTVTSIKSNSPDRKVFNKRHLIFTDESDQLLYSTANDKADDEDDTTS